MIDAQRKKPKVPVHAMVTAHNPMVALSAAMTCAKSGDVRVWLQTLPKWEQTTTPYLLHTPDIAQAPELVDALWQACRLRCRPWQRAVHSAAIFSFLISLS
jgi:hypothetical protein